MRSNIKCRVHGLKKFPFRYSQVTSQLTSPPRKAEQNPNIHMCSKSFIVKNMLGYENYVHEVIKIVMNSENACCQSLQVHLSSRFLPRDRDQMHKAITAFGHLPRHKI
jgi:hypothetical protein